MSKDSYKNMIANKRKDIVSLRAKLVKIKDDKKRRMEALSKYIKSTSSASSKESYRKLKISGSARYDREIESLKMKVETAKRQIEQTKKTLANLK
ncbi:hypothetical protein [Pedobacter sp. CFBP9032]|uniref:hypothetical protein n=1 Tax=Pedobacter sp. CFBP9032 TaxID=3096539 RepID=UPI002A6A2642|nr:hypothetical protein [Pedobacter sp. CFBP9032]MDY0904532.1 hypothetical protein [Pedobacter sp. CFBP9032]